MLNIDELELYLSDDDYKVSNYISVRKPAVKEVLEYGEDNYFTLLHLIVRKPFDVALELWDKGIDYQEVSDYDIFLDTAPLLGKAVTSILFNGLDFTEYEKESDMDSGLVRLVNKYDSNNIIDVAIYNKIAALLRYAHYISPKDKYDVGNAAAKKFLMERLRRKRAKEERERKMGRQEPSVIYGMARYLVLSPGFPYGLDGIMNLTLFQLYDFYAHLAHYENRNRVLTSVYNGKIDPTKITDRNALEAFPALHI